MVIGREGVRQGAVEIVVLYGHVASVPRRDIWAGKIGVNAATAERPTPSDMQASNVPSISSALTVSNREIPKD